MINTKIFESYIQIYSICNHLGQLDPVYLNIKKPSYIPYLI